MLKMKNINLKAILVLVIMLLAGSCTKDWEEMNVDPNNPTDVPTGNILNWVIRHVADTHFDEWTLGNEHGSYAGHISKIQYIDEARYQFRESVVNGQWNNFYLQQLNVQKIYEKAVEDEDVNMQAAALTLKCFLYQMMTDWWGDIPYSEALQGEEEVTNPKYDSQQSIYAGIISDLALAADLFSPSAGSIENDNLFGGDASLWQKWCNSLRLRVAVRISNVDPAGATAIFNAILGNASYPIMGSNDDAAVFQWTSSSPYREPFWEDKYLSNRDDHAVASYIIDKLKELNDPRISEYAFPADSDGEYRGIVPGLATADEGFDLASMSRIGQRYRETPDGLTYFQRYSEVLFIIAEALERGLTSYAGMTAQGAYEAAITASMEEHGVTTGNINAYIAQAEVAYDGTLDKIYIQKWISLFKTHEAWPEIRRTDVPLMPMAPGSPYPGHNRSPFRYPYAQDEKNLNPSNIAPALDGIADHFWGKQMWWDTRTGVN